jgi:hypothetical protein
MDDKLKGTELSEAKKAPAPVKAKQRAVAARQNSGDVQRKIRNRISFIKNRLKLPINASVAATALNDYVSKAKKSPNLTHYRILQSMSTQKRDTVSKLNSAVPLNLIVNAPEGQLRRALRDIIKEQKETLNEAMVFNPPAMLLLKRQAIRVFPNGQRVALYADNKYGLSFPVPYDITGKGFNMVNTVGSGPINSLPGYVGEETLPVLFATGEEILVEEKTMEKIKDVYGKLSDQNKQILSDMILESEESFNVVKNFALSIK